MTEPRAVDGEERREAGTAWMVIGALCWLVALLVMFFHPAAWKLGKPIMVEIASVLSIVGLVVFFLGWRVRRNAE